MKIYLQRDKVVINIDEISTIEPLYVSNVVLNSNIIKDIPAEFDCCESIIIMKNSKVVISEYTIDELISIISKYTNIPIIKGTIDE